MIKFEIPQPPLSGVLKSLYERNKHVFESANEYIVAPFSSEENARSLLWFMTSIDEGKEAPVSESVLYTPLRKKPENRTGIYAIQIKEGDSKLNEE